MKLGFAIPKITYFIAAVFYCFFAKARASIGILLPNMGEHWRQKMQSKYFATGVPMNIVGFPLLSLQAVKINLPTTLCCLFAESLQEKTWHARQKLIYLKLPGTV